MFKKNFSVLSICTYSIFGFIFWHLAKEMLQVRNDGWYVGQVNLYGDLVYHLALINKFLISPNALVDSPIFAGEKVNYPIFVDYITSVITKSTGVDFALFITTVLGAALVLIIAKMFIKTYIKNDSIALITFFLFFLNGGFGFYYLAQDYITSQKPFLDFIFALPREYTDLKELGFWWINSYLAYFLPQRGFLFAFPITLTVLLLLYKGFKKTSTNHFLIAGFLSGSLALVQTHSLFVIFLLCLYFAPLTILINRKKQVILNWILFAGITAVVAMPLFKIISSISNPFEYIRFDPGWTSQENFIWFWFKNLGLFAPIWIVSTFWLFKKTKLFYLYLPFLGIFAVANVWIFQPWEFDNSKLLIYWYFTSCIVVACFLWHTFFSGNLLRKIIGTLLVLIMIASGSIDIFRTFTKVSSYQIFSSNDLEVAKQVQLLTPEDSVFATASNHNNPIPTLSGRSTVIGFHGWVWSHGGDFQERAEDVSTLYAGGPQAENVIKKYKIRYVTVGPQEMEEFSINLSYFQKYPQLNAAKDWRIYDVSNIWSNSNR